MIRRRVVVAGIVQGVGFRWSARAEAQRLGVAGWVRNRPDGGVEAEVEGDHAVVEAMIAWLRTGPSSAAVSGVSVEEIDPTGDPGFSIAR